MKLPVDIVDPCVCLYTAILVFFQNHTNCTQTCSKNQGWWVIIDEACIDLDLDWCLRPPSGGQASAPPRSCDHWDMYVDTHKVHFWTVHLLLHTQILPITVYFVALHCKCIGIVQKSASTHFCWGLHPGSVGDSGNEPSQLPGWSLDQTQKCFHPFRS